MRVINLSDYARGESPRQKLERIMRDRRHEDAQVILFPHDTARMFYRLSMTNILLLDYMMNPFQYLK